MTWARLRLTLSEDSWFGTVSRSYPEATVRIVAGLPGEDTGIGLVTIDAADPASVVASIVDHESVRRLTRLEGSAGEMTIQVESTESSILRAAERSGVPIDWPIRISEGEATVDVAGAHEQISEFGRQLVDDGIDYEVDSIGSRPTADRLLTDTQKDLALAAIECGYYETPRECTLTELADRVGIAKSTASETLQRVEAKLVRQFVGSPSPERPLTKPA